jgi:predicted NUDIX family phosphoesterase
MSQEEEVLVIPESLFDSLGRFSGFQNDVTPYLSELLNPANMQFRKRGQVEDDPTFKQLIPYCILLHTDTAGTTHIFRYTRGKGQGEQRLHAKQSIGIGGHISREDAAGSNEPYRTGMRRELDEEVIIDSHYDENLAGMIFDDTTEVGRVHLGLVHCLRLQTPNARGREADLLDSGFVPLETLRENFDRLETWSQLCVKHLFPAV